MVYSNSYRVAPGNRSWTPPPLPGKDNYTSIPTPSRGKLPGSAYEYGVGWMDIKYEAIRSLYENLTFGVYLLLLIFDTLTPNILKIKPTKSMIAQLIIKLTCTSVKLNLIAY